MIDRLERGSRFGEVLAEYKKAWETGNVDLALSLFTADASYQEDPFDRRPMKGLVEIRDYWAQVPRLQKHVSFKHGRVFHLEGTRVWGAEWEARYKKVETGKLNRLRGVLFCELRGGRIRRFWEYWHVRGGGPAFTAAYHSRRTGKMRKASS